MWFKTSPDFQKAITNAAPTVFKGLNVKTSAMLYRSDVPSVVLYQKGFDTAAAANNVKTNDIGITGTIEGYTATEGVRDAYFTTAPEFVFTQVGNTSKLRQGIGRYEAEKGSAIVLLYPEGPGAWNGKMWLTAHGAGAEAVGAHGDDRDAVTAGGQQTAVAGAPGEPHGDGRRARGGG